MVQTLHNFRLLCPSGNFFRDGHVCEECVSHTLFRSVTHGCYHDSRIATAAIAGMLAVHGLLQTWEKQVDVFLVCTEFARGRFVAAGFDETCIRVKPNFIAADPGATEGPGNTVLFIGRLSPEKGPQLLPPAWSKLPGEIPLEIAGDGPLRASLEEDCARLGLRSVHFAGWLGRAETIEQLREAKFLIVPSTCYEGFPLAVAEAYACGVPVITSGHGSLAEIVRHESTGLHFTPGDINDLAAKVAWAWAHPDEMRRMGRAARIEFETKYTAAAVLKHLEAAYRFALRRRGCSAVRAEGFIPAESRPLASQEKQAD